MSVVSFEIKAEPRQVVGKGASRRLRRLDNQVPAILYGTGKEPVMLMLNHFDVLKALSHEAFYSHILTLHVGGASEKVVLKALQRHPFKPRILHMDFMRVDSQTKLRRHVPLHFVGQEQAPGVVAGHGVISHYISDVEIHCLPADLPEFITVDLSTLELNDVVHLSALKLPKGVELLSTPKAGSDHDHPVASLHLPKVVVEEEIPTEAPVAAEVPTISATEADAEEKK